VEPTALVIGSAECIIKGKTTLKWYLLRLKKKKPCQHGKGAFGLASPEGRRIRECSESQLLDLILVAGLYVCR